MKDSKLIVIFIICVVVIIGLICFKKDGMTEEEIRTLIEKGTSYDNLYSLEETSNEKKERFLKDDILVIKTESMLVWKDFNTNEIITIKDNYALVQKDSRKFVKYTMEDYLDESKYKIVYEKEDIFEGKDCVYVKVYNINDEPIAMYTIDKETGLPEQTEMSGNYTYSIGTVTDEDVKKPDLSKYNVVKPE